MHELSCLKVPDEQWRVVNAHAHPYLLSEGVISFTVETVFNTLHTTSETDAQNFNICCVELRELKQL